MTSQALHIVDDLNDLYVHRQWTYLPSTGFYKGRRLQVETQRARFSIGLLQQAIHLRVDELSLEEYAGKKSEFMLLSELAQLKSLLAVSVWQELWVTAANARVEASAAIVQPYLEWYDEQTKKAKHTVNSRSLQSSEPPFDELIQLLHSARSTMKSGHQALRDLAAQYAPQQWVARRTAAGLSADDTLACQTAIRAHSIPYTLRNLTQCIIDSFRPVEVMPKRLAKLLRHHGGSTSFSPTESGLRNSTNNPCERSRQVYNMWLSLFDPTHFTGSLPVLPSQKHRHLGFSSDREQCIALRHLLGDELTAEDWIKLRNDKAWCLPNSDTLPWINGSNPEPQKEEEKDEMYIEEMSSRQLLRQSVERRREWEHNPPSWHVNQSSKPRKVTDAVIGCICLLLLDVLILKYI